MNSSGSYVLTDAERERLKSASRLTSGGAAEISDLIAMLTDSSWMVRREVVQTLARVGKAAVEPLCAVLVSKRDHEGRIAATVDALVASTASVEESVLRLATNSDPAIVADVVQILGRRKNPSSVPALIELTRHTDDNVAVGALEALGRIGGRAAVEALVATTETGNFFRTFPAIDVLGRSGDPRAIEPLTRLLKNPSYLPEAARALGRTGEKSAVESLLSLLVSSSESIVRLTAAALWDLREKAEEKTPGNGVMIDLMLRSLAATESFRRLIRVFPRADASESFALCKLFGTIGDLEAAGVLTTALDGPAGTATAAAEALKKIGKEADDQLLGAIRDGGSERRKVLLPMVTRSLAFDDVSSCLQDPDSDVRALACDTLARIGNGTAVPEVFKLLSDGNLRVVHAATAAIQSLGTREARRLAIESAKSENAVVRRSSLRILGYFGDADALPTLLEGLKDSDPRVREAALQGLPYLEDSRATEALIEESKSPNPRTRGLAVRSLGQVPKSSERIISLLLKSLRDEDPWVRYYACQSLGRLGYAAAAPDIAKLFHDEAGQVRVSAVEALSHLDSPDAYLALREATGFADVDVRRAALVGLGIAHRNEDLPLILDGVRSNDVPTRLISLSSLVNFHSPLVIGALSSAGNDSDDQVRSAAIGFLAARPEQEATEILIPLLAKDSTRDNARAALLIPSQSRVSGLLATLHSVNDEIAPLVVSILSRIDRPEARTALLSGMKLENVAARKAVASALNPHRSAEMRAVLVEASENDPNDEVRKICVLRLKD